MAGFLSTLFGGGAETEAAEKNQALLQQNQRQGTGYLGTSYNQGRTDLGQAVGAFAPLATLGQQYNQSGNAMMNALGVNGPGGYAQAMQDFHTGPGFNFMRDQALQAVDRRRAGGNMYNSGNADIDTINTAEGVANQEFQNYIKNLQAGGQMGLQATGAAAQGQAAGFGSLAHLAQTYGQDLTGLGNTTTSGMMDANKFAAAGQAAGAKNALGAGLSLASLAAGGMGGLGGSLFGNALGGAMGGAYGGSAQAPLAGLSASDYGPGAGFLDQYGLA